MVSRAEVTGHWSAAVPCSLKVWCEEGWAEVVVKANAAAVAAVVVVAVVKVAMLVLVRVCVRGCCTCTCTTLPPLFFCV